MLNRTPVSAAEIEADESRLLFLSMYGAAFALYLYPLADLLYTLIPFNLGSVQWRFGAAGFGAQTLWSQLLALALVALSAWYTGHRIALRLLAGYTLVLVLVIGVVGVLTSLDYLQLRRAIVQPMKPKLDAAAVRLYVQLGVAVAVAVPLALGSWRAGRSPTVKRRGDELGRLYGVRAKQSSRGAT